jgi:hypothetical protein
MLILLSRIPIYGKKSPNSAMVNFWKGHFHLHFCEELASQPAEQVGKPKSKKLEEKYKNWGVYTSVQSKGTKRGSVEREAGGKRKKQARLRSKAIQLEVEEREGTMEKGEREAGGMLLLPSQSPGREG